MEVSKKADRHACRQAGRQAGNAVRQVGKDAGKGKQVGGLAGGTAVKQAACTWALCVCLTTRVSPSLFLPSPARRYSA